MINYNLDINCEDLKITTSTLELVSGDVGAYNLSFAFLNDGKRMDLTGLLPTLKAKRADGVTLSQIGEIKDNRAVFKLESGIYAVPGELYLEIALSDSAKNYVTTKVIIANVIKGLGDTDEVAKTVPSVYVTLLNQTQNKLNSVDSLLSETKGILANSYTNADIDAKFNSMAYSLKRKEIGEKFPVVCVTGAYPNTYATVKVTPLEGVSLEGMSVSITKMETGEEIKKVKVPASGIFDYTIQDGSELCFEVYKSNGLTFADATLDIEYVTLDVSRLKKDIKTLQEVVGDIETALDNIIALQNATIGGGGK